MKWEALESASQATALRTESFAYRLRQAGVLFLLTPFRVLHQTDGTHRLEWSGSAIQRWRLLQTTGRLFLPNHTLKRGVCTLQISVLSAALAQSTFFGGIGLPSTGRREV